MNTAHPLDTDVVELNSVHISFADIRNVVEQFYGQVQTHPVLKAPFASVTDWPHHIERLTHFWWIRLGGDPYLDVMYNPVGKHFTAGFNREFLQHWLALFQTTLDKVLTAEQAQMWHLLATRMGSALASKNDYLINSMENALPK